MVGCEGERSEREGSGGLRWVFKGKRTFVHDKTRLPGSDGKRSERGRWWIEVDFIGKRTLVVRNKTRPPAGCSP